MGNRALGMKQEQLLDVAKKNEFSKKKSVRQDRQEISEDDFHLEINDKKFEVINFSSFGILIYSDQCFDENFKGNDIPLRFEDVEMARLALRKVREEECGSAGWKIAFEIVSEPLNVERVRTVFQVKQILREESKRQKEVSLVSQKFRTKVFEIRDSMDRLYREIENFQKENPFSSNADLETFERTVVEVVSNFLHSSFQPMYQALSEILKGEDETNIKASYEYFRAKLKDILYRSPLSERSYSKPLGYSGDYEMMNLIYRRELMGNSLFSKCVHQYYTDLPESRAVRNRSVYLKNKIKDLIFERKGKATKILSVASGPAREIQLILTEETSLDFSGVELHLLDQDVLSLKHAQRAIKEISWKTDREVSVRYLHKSIKNVIGQGLEDGDYDLIYSAGLFDYFSDPVAQMAGRKLFSCLKPQGRLIVGNFNVSAPSGLLMKMALDWYLIYRSETDLKKLFGDLDGKLRIESEPENVNLFCIVEK